MSLSLGIFIYFVSFRPFLKESILLELFLSFTCDFSGNWLYYIIYLINDKSP